MSDRVLFVDLEKYKTDNNLQKVDDVMVDDENVLNAYHGYVSGNEELRIDIIHTGVSEISIIGTNNQGNKVRYSYIVEVQSSLAGDIDGNAELNLKDVILLLQICAGLEKPVFYSQFSDVNGNNSVDLAEGIYVLQHIIY